MIPNQFIYLAAQEFQTYELAIAAGAEYFGVPRHSLHWQEPIGVENFALFTSDSPVLTQAEIKEMRPQVLPSGFWSWVPNDPEDLKAVYKFKKTHNKDFGATQLISESIEVVKSSFADRHNELESIKRTLVGNVSKRFAIVACEAAKIYRVKLKFETTERTCDRLIISANLFYAEDFTDSIKSN